MSGCRQKLELDHFGKWAVVRDEQLFGVYDTFDEAADAAIRNFGRGPYLIREVGAGPIHAPALIALPAHLCRVAADSPGRPDDLVTYGPTLPVRIGFDPASALGRETISLPAQLHHALVDTGAFASCIDSDLAAVLTLPIINRQPMAVVHGSANVNVHLAADRGAQLGPDDSWALRRSPPDGWRATAPCHHRGATFLRGMRLSYDGSTGEVILGAGELGGRIGVATARWPATPSCGAPRPSSLKPTPDPSRRAVYCWPTAPAEAPRHTGEMSGTGAPL